MGKTSLVIRFDEDSFSTKFITTIGVDYRDKLVDIEGSPIKLQVRCPPRLTFPPPLLFVRASRRCSRTVRLVCALFADLGHGRTRALQKFDRELFRQSGRACVGVCVRAVRARVVRAQKECDRVGSRRSLTFFLLIGAGLRRVL